MHNELYKHRSPKVFWDGFFRYLNFQKSIKIVKAVHLVPKTNTKWNYLRSPIIDFFFSFLVFTSWKFLDVLGSGIRGLFFAIHFHLCYFFKKLLAN